MPPIQRCAPLGPEPSICHGHLSVERRKRDRGMAFHHGRPYQPSQCPTTHASLVSQPFAARCVELVWATNFLDLLGELQERCLTGPESVPVNAVQSSETGGQEQEHGSFPVVRKL